MIAHPFLKWPGGKRSLLPLIKDLYPEDLGRGTDTYIEPFIGGGAVLFDVLRRGIADARISDINPELCSAYIAVRDDIDDLVSQLDRLESAHLRDVPGRKDLYLRCRAEFNRLKRTRNADCTELAALLIYLNHTCFNGLYRTNSAGDFNAAFGHYENPTILDEPNLRACSAALKNVTITAADFRTCEPLLIDGTFAYFDPPYPKSDAMYTADRFGNDMQRELARLVKRGSEEGAYCVVSNSDDEDGLIRSLYPFAEIIPIQASRRLCGDATRRKKAPELLIAAYPKRNEETEG